MEFKKDKTYSFSEIMAYGFLKNGEQIFADGHLYLGDNSFDAVIDITLEVLLAMIKKSDDKSGAFEKAVTEWLATEKEELFLPDLFPEPIHCKLGSSYVFRFEKAEIEESDFDPEKVFYFSLEK